MVNAIQFVGTNQRSSFAVGDGLGVGLGDGLVDGVGDGAPLAFFLFTAASASFLIRAMASGLMFTAAALGERRLPYLTYGKS